MGLVLTMLLLHSRFGHKTTPFDTIPWQINGHQKGRKPMQASIFKRTPTSKWTGRYTDEHGKVRDEALCTDKSVALNMLANLVKRSERGRAGLADSYSDHAQEPLQTHLDAYQTHLIEKGNTDRHVNLEIARINRVVVGCGFRRLPDIRPAMVTAFLQKQDFSPTTSNHHLRAAKSFLGWCVDHGRLLSNPLAPCKPMRTAHDLRHKRRCLSPIDFAKLLATTLASPRTIKGKGWKLTGEDRHLLYLVAAYTGLRAKELSSLTVNSFDFSENEFTLPATDTKNRTEAILPVQDDISKELQRYIQDNEITYKLWAGRWFEIAAKIIRRDLEDANIPYTDNNGKVFDFHSLRVHFITSLARNNVPLVKAQKLARHSTPVLTANFYTHLETTDLRESVNMLPSMLPSPSLPIASAG